MLAPRPGAHFLPIFSKSKICTPPRPQRQFFKNGHGVQAAAVFCLSTKTIEQTKEKRPIMDTLALFRRYNLPEPE